MTRFVVVLAALVGCKGGDVRVHGTVPPGQQPSTALQGQAPAGDADRARVSRVEDDGSTTVLAEGEVQADGSFDATVPAGEEKLVVEAVDASGTVVASALLESSGSGGGEVTLPPLDAESTLEALVFVDLVASGSASLSDADPCDLRARIDARVAAAAEAAHDSTVHALATAIAAAQSARVRAWEELGVHATGEEVFEAELDAAARLDASLASGADAATAGGQYLEDLAAAAASLGVSAEAEAEATSQSTLALRASALGDLEEPCLLAAARAEAHATGAAAIDATGDARDAVDRLRAAVDAAESTEEAASAFGDFRADLVGSGSVDGSVLADALDLGLAGDATAEIAVEAAVTAGDALEAAISGAHDDAADLAVRAWGTYRDAVDAAASALPEPEVGATILVCATGSFR